MRYTVLEKLCLRWPRCRHAWNLLGRVVDTAPSSGELAATDCFSRVAENERLALEGLIAGGRFSAPAAASHPPDENPTESAG